MKLVIIGAGKVGSSLVASLLKENHDISVIDSDRDVVTDIVDKYDVMGYVGGCCERDVLSNAGVQDADFVIACTEKDELNVLSSVLCKKMGADKVIARVREPEFFAGHGDIGADLGIDEVFNPEYATAQEIAHILRFPFAVNVETFADGTINMAEIVLHEDNALVGKSVKEIMTTYGAKVLFGIVVRNDKALIPNGDFVFEVGDYVYMLGAEGLMASLCRQLHIMKRSAKSVFIVGGGKIAYYLAKELLEDDIAVKIVERDQEVCQELSEQLPNATIICGDGSDQELLDSEDIDKADACVTLTNMDEENIITSLYAVSCDVNKVVTKINRPTLSKTVKKLGLDTIVSPLNVIADEIIRIVRAYENEKGESADRLYRVNDKVELAEFTVGDTFEKLGVPLKDMKIKKNILLCGISRDGETVLPNGDTTIEIGDKILVVADKSISELKDIIR